MSQIRNLDTGSKEYFDFIVKGHTYRFTHPTLNEIRELDKVKDNEDKTTEKFFKFISKVEKDSPEWETMFEKLTVPHVKAFRAMIDEEFSMK